MPDHATARHLALVPDAAGAPPASPVPAQHIVFPDGVRVPVRPRGVYRVDIINGTNYVLFAVDSSGDWREMIELVPLTATLEEFRAAELRLWALLDACDPVVQPCGRRMLGPPDPM